MQKKDREEQNAPICNIYINPKYTKNPVSLHDLALAKLCKPLTFTPYIKRIALSPKKLTVPDSASVTVAGWGKTEEGGIASTLLKKVDLKTTSFSYCKKLHPYITKGQICAAVVKGGKGSCQGDSGGPLWYKTNGKRYLVGVVSLGRGCARPHDSALYTNVAHYRDWIDRTMRTRENILPQPRLDSSLSINFK